MMASNAVCAADARIIRRIVSTRVPARQAVVMVSDMLMYIRWRILPVPSAECQLQIRFCLTALDLAACRWLAISPSDAFTARVCWGNLHCAPRKTVAKHVTHVIPHLVPVETIREIGLANIWLEETAFDWANLERNSAGCRVDVEGLAVGSVFGDGLLLSNATTNRPQVDWFVALICHDGATNGLRTGCEGNSSDSERVKKHDDQWKRMF
jgi:hypothetical protein